LDTFIPWTGESSNIRQGRWKVALGTSMTVALEMLLKRRYPLPGRISGIGIFTILEKMTPQPKPGWHLPSCVGAFEILASLLNKRDGCRDQ